MLMRERLSGGYECIAVNQLNIHCWHTSVEQQAEYSIGWKPLHCLCRFHAGGAWLHLHTTCVFATLWLAMGNYARVCSIHSHVRHGVCNAPCNTCVMEFDGHPTWPLHACKLASEHACPVHDHGELPLLYPRFARYRKIFNTIQLEHWVLSV